MCTYPPQASVAVGFTSGGKGTGYSGVENALFYTDNCRMLYGDAQPMAGHIIQHLKAMG